MKNHELEFMSVTKNLRGEATSKDSVKTKCICKTNFQKIERKIIAKIPQH